MFTVRPEEIAAVLERCAAWDVEAIEIGEVVPQKRTRVDWHGTTVLDLDLEFTTGGPAYRRPSLEPEAPTAAEVELEQPADIPHSQVIRIFCNPGEFLSPFHSDS